MGDEWKFVVRHTAARTRYAERFFVVMNGVGEVADAEEMTTTRSFCGESGTLKFANESIEIDSTHLSDCLYSKADPVPR